MKNKFYLLLTLAICLISHISYADLDKQAAIIDIDHIIAESLAYKDLTKQLDLKKKNHNDVLTKANSLINNKARDLDKQKAALSPEAFEKKNNALQGEANEFQKKLQNLRTELENLHNNGLKQIEEALHAIVKEYAQKNKITLVLPSATTLYYQDSMNITETILKDLNNKIKTVTLK